MLDRWKAFAKTHPLHDKQAGWDRVTASRLVCNSPCFLLGVFICSAGTNAGTASIQNGHVVGDPTMMDLSVLTDQWQDASLRHPIFLNKGMHVTIGDNITSVTVHYHPIRE